MEEGEGFSTLMKLHLLPQIINSLKSLCVLVSLGSRKMLMVTYQLTTTVCSSPMISLTDGDLPADYYRLFLINDFTDYLVTETYRYAAQTLAAARESGPISPHSRLKGQVPVDRTAIQHFIGLQLLTGLVQKPSIASYWSKLPILQTPIFASVMPRNRFQEILCFWHANNKQ